jgi:hypothetical protein
MKKKTLLFVSIIFVSFLILPIYLFLDSSWPFVFSRFDCADINEHIGINYMEWNNGRLKSVWTRKDCSSIEYFYDFHENGMPKQIRYRDSVICKFDTLGNRLSR